MTEQNATRVFAVSGMTCGHCKSAVESAIREVEGIETVQVDLKAGKAILQGDASDASVLTAVEEAGYEAQPIPQA